MPQEYSSKLLNNAVNQFAKLPGIGSKTALRLVLHLLRKEQNEVLDFCNSLVELTGNVKYCKQCNNLSDNDICEVCANPRRDATTICVVENIKEVVAIENTQQYHGVYHVLGGIISPIDGIGPSDLKIDLLESRLTAGNVKEVIFALSTTMEGDTTNFYLYKKLSKFGVKISTLSRGVSVGGELEYTDEVTLGRSIVNRVIFSPL